jgi:hypothetical protein
MALMRPGRNISRRYPALIEGLQIRTVLNKMPLSYI